MLPGGFMHFPMGLVRLHRGLLYVRYFGQVLAEGKQLAGQLNLLTAGPPRAPLGRGGRTAHLRQATGHHRELAPWDCAAALLAPKRLHQPGPVVHELP